LTGPIICLVTNRRRLKDSSDAALFRRVREAAEAGVSLVQVRERDVTAAGLVALVRGTVEAVSGTAARVLVNERADVAFAADAHGVHLRADSAAADRVRGISPPHWIIGRSVHTVEEALSAEREGVDYVFFGTVFPTASKAPGHPIAGPEALRRVCTAVRIPVVAIGGVTLDNVRQVVEAGAAGVSGIGLFADAAAGNQQGTGGHLRVADVVASLLRAFDTRSGLV
jgi:thiamine-phosphate diphosphorylase